MARPIMEQFQDRWADIFRYDTPTKPTGVINMIRPDGTQPAPMDFTAAGRSTCRGALTSTAMTTSGSATSGRSWRVLMAGDDTKGHPAGTKTGDVIHLFQSGSIQMVTDVAIDPAGNVWAANNWNQQDSVMATIRSAPPRPGAEVRALRSSTASPPR